MTGFFTLLSKCLLLLPFPLLPLLHHSTLTSKKINPTCVANAIPHTHRAIEQAGMMMKVSVPTAKQLTGRWRKDLDVVILLLFS